ncbi:Flagellar hook-basal body complex protein FliE [bioreactor metagenome]|jgi:flagellar hook-basal body complex protein FliE|uniref:Flagellar hook-basal body complex protein FliE n=1 Tax=bioreactor metagenome TaxID=1076179 RepID=A0A645IKF9_9ZZZZ|nr:flagellar hook-basal body complex protein FliE [Dechloromonas sp. CZR5]MBL8404386.1 flagellar hook-basal body complex protein FliE [Dechloromonas sp.]MCH2221990.1 flagellar hook-basal body complex protein FliE [Dechloromonas sp.]
MDTNGIEQMLSVLRTTAAQASGKAAAPVAGGSDFAQILQGSIDKVNETQRQANQMAEKLAAGDTSQNLHEVMIALQTASVSFQEMVQVRNKLVSAYQDVMNIQV